MRTHFGAGKDRDQMGRGPARRLWKLATHRLMGDRGRGSSLHEGCPSLSDRRRADGDRGRGSSLDEGCPALSDGRMHRTSHVSLGADHSLADGRMEGYLGPTLLL